MQCVSIFSSRVICGDCGGYYGRKIWHSNTKHASWHWHCNAKFQKRKYCETPTLKEESLEETFVEVFNGLIVYSYRPKPGAEAAIYRQISDITISMKSTDHLKMPELISNAYKVYLSPDERETYDEMKKQFVLDLPDGEITAANAAALSGKLSQLANGAIYDDTGSVVPIHDRKLDALEDIIESANGKPLLVAYWYQHDLERIAKRLHERHIPFSKLDKADSIRRWNNGEIPVALIHPASAGHGLNLQTGGSIIVWFGLTWSLELYSQTIARLWRQGQTSETVVVQHMSPPTKELMKLVLEQRIAHAGHPVLRWMMDNIYVRTDPAGNIKPDKEKSTEKIDGAVATIMALDRAIRCGNDTGESVYDKRGILFL